MKRDERAAAKAEAAERTLELVAAAREGDQDAFERLVEMKRNQVFRTAWQQVGQVDDARTVAQAVFVRLWKNLHRFDPTRNFDTWLYQVTVNAAIDHHRRQRHRFRESEFDETFDLKTAPDSPPGSPSGNAQALVEAKETQRILGELAAELTDRQRTAFLLREVEGLTTGEVAETLGTSESTVRNHVFQARKLLRQALIERYPEYARQPADTEEGT